MKHPKKDLVNRQHIWDAMHVLWLDTDVEGFYFSYAVDICVQSKYSIDELKRIYWHEVYPTLRFNLMPWDVAGEWYPVDIESLSEEILKRHKFRKPIFFKRLRRYAFQYWDRLEKNIIIERSP